MGLRLNAREKGEKFYSSFCNRCGTSKRRVDSGSCVQCAKERRKRVYHEAKKSRGQSKVFDSFCSVCSEKTSHYSSNGNCVKCSNTRSMIHYQSNREDCIDRFRKHYHENRESRLRQGRKWYEKNKHKLKSYYAKYREENKDKIRAWRRSESAMAKHRKRQASRYKTPSGKAEMSLRNMVYRMLKGERCGSAVSLVGYLPSDLVSHIENQFQAGMSWDNYGEWHIDHV